MRYALCLRISILLLCASLFFANRSAEAQGVSSGQAAAIFGGIVAVSAAVGVGIYYVARRAPRITGCVASDANGLQLRSETDQQIYLLVGDTASLKAGERVRVIGKKKTKVTAHARTFIVEKLSKDFGPCSPQAVVP